LPVAAAVATVGAAAIGASSASKAAKKAANAQVAAADAATALQRETYYDQRALLAPSITAGADARARQMLMMGYSPDQVRAYLRSTAAAVNAPGAGDTQRPGGQFLDGFTNSEGQWEVGPGSDAQPANGADYSWVDGYDWAPQSPSYQWRFDQGQKAVERSKAAGGDFFSGDTAMALQNYGQNAASQEFEADWRRLGELAGDGTQATGTTVNVAGQFGQSAANNTMAAGNARATGYQQAGNAWGNFWQGAAGIPMYGLGQGWWGGSKK